MTNDGQCNPVNLPELAQATTPGNKIVSPKPTRVQLLDLAATLAAIFATRAAAHDANGTFPYENFDDLRAANYPALTVPEALGGWGASMLDAVMAQEVLAMGDGSTALAMTMHVQTIGVAATGEKWNQELFKTLCDAVITRGALINSCASEPELGSPSRGGKPTTTARREGDNWIINGRKSFASLSPVLDYFIIPAALEPKANANDVDMVGRFLVPRQPGLVVEDNWDSMGMRGTGSNDITLTDVSVSHRALISQSPASAPDPNRAVQNAWFALTVSAVYLGVAAAAQKVALQFAHERIPTALGKPIATLESIQRRIGESELALHSARSILYHTAEQWDTQPTARGDMGEAMIIAKLTATNAAITIVDHAMRVVGGASMTHRLPLERYYRDVRAGLYHPPADDGALPLLGRLALQRIAPLPPPK
jgi:alkylation response protein AidB-like acyl-CoA dehydrogenase